jgi:hypothetical protein
MCSTIMPSNDVLQKMSNDELNEQRKICYRTSSEWMERSVECYTILKEREGWIRPENRIDPDNPLDLTRLKALPPEAKSLIATLLSIKK